MSRMLEQSSKFEEQDRKELGGRPSSIGPKPPRRIRLIPVNELRVRPAAYLIKGIIPRTGLVVVWGPPKRGKSYWVSGLVMHIASERPYRGHRVRRGNVVYCALEGQGGYGARVEAYRRQCLDEGESVPGFYLIFDPIDLVKDHQTLVARINEQAETPDVVVIDTLNRSLNGSESKDADMSAYVRAADFVRDAFQCAVIIVHHCGVDGSRPRGHTSFAGADDVQISIARNGSGQIIATVDHAKDMPDGVTIVSRLASVDLGTDEDGDPITSCVIEPVEGEAGAPVRRVTGAAKVALNLLQRALVDGGAIPPANNSIPPGDQGRKTPAPAHHLSPISLPICPRVTLTLCV